MYICLKRKFIYFPIQFVCDIQSCTVVTGDAGTVFDYTVQASATPACVQRVDASGCASGT